MHSENTCFMCGKPTVFHIAALNPDLSKSKSLQLCAEHALELGVDPLDMLDGKSGKIKHIEKLIEWMAEHENELQPADIDLPDLPEHIRKFAENHAEKISQKTDRTSGRNIPNSTNVDKAICPNCRLSKAELFDKMSVGCTTCYQVFADEISELLEPIHGVAVHDAKANTNNLMLETTLMSERDILQGLLEEAIADEAYELAQQIKIQLDALDKGGING